MRGNVSIFKSQSNETLRRKCEDQIDLGGYDSSVLDKKGINFWTAFQRQHTDHASQVVA